MTENILRIRRMNSSKINLGNLLVLLGMGWLGFSFWLPYGTAQRVFRIETRVSDVTRMITQVAREMDDVDWNSTEQRTAILAKVNERAGSLDPDSSRHLRIHTPPAHLAGKCFFFEGKHYFYMLTNPPPKVLGYETEIERAGKEEPPPGNPLPGNPPPGNPPPGNPPPGNPLPGDPLAGPPRLDVPLPDEQVLPFETYAWPKQKDTGSRTVFFVPSDARATFTRNLDNRYVGERRVPQPGCGRMDIESEKQENDYRGHDDERWIYQTRDALGK